MGEPSCGAATVGTGTCAAFTKPTNAAKVVVKSTTNTCVNHKGTAGEKVTCTVTGATGYTCTDAVCAAAATAWTGGQCTKTTTKAPTEGDDAKRVTAISTVVLALGAFAV